MVHKKAFMRTWPAVLVLALAGCATYYAARLDQLYGMPDPARFDRPADMGLDVGSRP